MNSPFFSYSEIVSLWIWHQMKMSSTYKVAYKMWEEEMEESLEIFKPLWVLISLDYFHSSSLLANYISCFPTELKLWYQILQKYIIKTMPDSEPLLLAEHGPQIGIWTSPGSWYENVQSWASPLNYWIRIDFCNKIPK